MQCLAHLLLPFLDDVPACCAATTVRGTTTMDEGSRGVLWINVAGLILAVIVYTIYARRERRAS